MECGVKGSSRVFDAEPLIFSSELEDLSCYGCSTRPGCDINDPGNVIG